MTTSAHSIAARFQPAAGPPEDVFVRLVDGQVEVQSRTVRRTFARERVSWPDQAPDPLQVRTGDGGVLEIASREEWLALWSAPTERDRGAAVLPPLVAVSPSTAAAAASPAPAGDGSSWWPLVAILALFVTACAAAYVYAVPLAAQLALRLVPPAVDEAIGAASFASMDGAVLRPSTLPDAQQEALRAAFARAVAQADAAAAHPTQVVFRSGEMGPNAFALPGGRIVVTDDLVRMVGGRADVVTGVLAHEYGHVRGRHGVRLVAQSAVLTLAMGLVFGDFSSLLAAGSRMLGEQAYSRDAEREADAESVRVMRAAGISPSVMVTFFEQLAAKQLGNTGGPAIAFASHPADAERMAFFTNAAR